MAQVSGECAGKSWRRATGAGMLLVLASLPGCSELALTKEDTPPAVDPANDKLVADYLKAEFKKRGSFDTFDISAYRWVHSIKGWSWLTCVRFRDRGYQRIYAVFIKDGAVVDSRFAVQTDACEMQTYSPFDALMGAVPPTSVGGQGPLY
jgi:hypothetical protein